MGGYLADREVLTAADWRQNMQLPFACVERLSLSLVGEGSGAAVLALSPDPSTLQPSWSCEGHPPLPHHLVCVERFTLPYLTNRRGYEH